MHITPETQQFIDEHQHDDVRSLALQAKKYPDVDIKMAINQIAGRQAIAYKIPSWYANDAIVYPAHLPLEQCSSEVTANYKSELCRGESLVDLTGGFGVDCAFMSQSFKTAIYVEKQIELCQLAHHNFSALQLPGIKVINGDGVEFLHQTTPVDCIFIDPARRNEHGGKTVLLADCTPDVSELEELLTTKADTTLIKLSPMLDISLALKELKSTIAVHILSVHNECKELLFVLNKQPQVTIPVHCINFTHAGRQQFSFTKEEESNATVEYTSVLSGYLYEPNASILKAGAYKSIAEAYQLKKLHPNSHLYTSDKLIDDFPGRTFVVEAYSNIKNKELLKGIKKANISVRNFPLSTNELRKRLKLNDGGEVYLFATTLSDHSKVLIRCIKPVSCKSTYL